MPGWPRMGRRDGRATDATAGGRMIVAASVLRGIRVSMRRATAEPTDMRGNHDGTSLVMPPPQTMTYLGRHGPTAHPSSALIPMDGTAVKPSATPVLGVHSPGGHRRGHRRRN